MSDLPSHVNRRELLLGAGVLAAAAAVPSLASAESQGGHGGHGAHGAMPVEGPHPNQAVISAAAHCVEMGEKCMDHCLDLFAAGDTSVAACARNVQQMLPMCKTLATFASLKSPHLKALAELCIKVCSDCEKECRKHEKHHAACKACADSCLECIKACKAITA